MHCGDPPLYRIAIMAVAAAVSQSKVMVRECYYPAGGLKLGPSGGVGAAFMISTHKDAKFTSSCGHNKGSRHLGDVSKLM